MRFYTTFLRLYLPPPHFDVSEYQLAPASRRAGCRREADELRDCASMRFAAMKRCEVLTAPMVIPLERADISHDSHARRRRRHGLPRI